MTVIVEITSSNMSVGIAGQEYVLIHKSAPYLLSLTGESLLSLVDENNQVELPVYENGTQQGVLRFTLPQEVCVSASVSISFRYDEDRILRFGIKLPGTNFYQEIHAEGVCG